VRAIENLSFELILRDIIPHNLGSQPLNYDGSPLPQSQSTLVLAAVLKVFKPLARFLLRHGVAYPAFALALKQVFVNAARDELETAGRKQTDSAVSLLSGVHRRDIRNLGLASAGDAAGDPDEPKNLSSQVVARWLSDPDYLDPDGEPLALARYGAAPSFDSLVTATSSDIRARTMLAELERLGIAQNDGSAIRLLAPGFAPRQGFAETLALLRDNLQDHAAATTLNADGGHNYLEQAVFVDELTEESVQQLHAVSARVWRQAFRTVMREAQARFDHDRVHASAEQRVHRARFGSYFYAANNDDEPV
jgi:hypothetical protein